MDLHERISRTAWIVAYCRTLSDIPYSRQIFDEAQKIAKLAVLSAEFENFKKSKDIEIAPTFEARYKLVNRILEENNAIQILEIAVAFFPRGIELTQNPWIAYVGTDFPGQCRKMRIIAKKQILQGKIPCPANFHLFKGTLLICWIYQQPHGSSAKDPLPW